MNLAEFQRSLRESIIRSNGHEVAKDVPKGHAQCPTCGKVYKFSKPRGQGEKWEREQHLGGYCSEKCWPLG